MTKIEEDNLHTKGPKYIPQYNLLTNKHSFNQDTGGQRTDQKIEKKRKN